MRKWEPLGMEDTKDILTTHLNLNPEAISFIQLLTKKKVVFSNRETWVHKLTVGGQQKINSKVFCFVLFKGFSFFFSFPLTMFCLGIFFPLQIFCLCIRVSKNSYGFSMWENLCVSVFMCVSCVFSLVLVCFVCLFCFFWGGGTVLFFILFIC